MSKYRAHILTCRGEAPQEAKVAETPQESKSKEPELKPKIPAERAREINSCRGDFEGKYREICGKYNKCNECWAHYGE